MINLISSKTATTFALRKIAKGFCLEKYPLTLAGEDLRSALTKVLVMNDWAWLDSHKYELPTIEHFRQELYQPLNYGQFEKYHIIGKLLIVVQVSKGCSHHCLDFCSVAAAPKIEQLMPMPAVLLLSDDKIAYDKEYWEICKSWWQYFKQEMRIDFGSDKFRNWMDEMPPVEFVCFVNLTNDLKKTHPIAAHLKLHPIDYRVADRIRYKWWEFFPLNFGSFRQHYINFDDSDPLNYRNWSLCHEDGRTADYSDVVIPMASVIRPVSIATAGWLPTDMIAERAAKRISRFMQINPDCVHEFRISIKRAEKLARTDFPAYMRNLKRMLCAIYPIHPDIEINYDERVIGDRDWAMGVRSELQSFYKDQFGEELEIPDLFHISHHSGYAYDPRYVDDFDARDCIDGVHIKSDGRVCCQEDAVWKELKDSTGNVHYRLGSPDSTPHPLSLKMW